MCGTDGGDEPGTREQVASLDADRLNVNHHPAVTVLGITDVLIPEHARAPVLVDHCSFHTDQLSLVNGTLEVCR